MGGSSAESSSEAEAVAPAARPPGPAAARWLLGALTALVPLALALRLGPRDAHWLPAVLYYATPWPVLALLAAAATCLAAWLRRPRAALAWAALAWAAGLTCAATQWRTAPPPPRAAADVPAAGAPAATPLRVAYWNLMNGAAGADALGPRLRALDADLLCLGEAGPRAAPHELLDELPRLLPDHVPLARWRTLWVGARRGLPVRLRAGGGAHDLAGGGVALVLPLELAGRHLTLVVADLKSLPWLPREPPIAALRALLPPAPARWLVVGDFNTPLESRSFDAWRAEGRHAAAQAATGYLPTWPVPAPVLTIDHVWLGPGLVARRAETISTLASDHRALVVALELRGAEEPRATPRAP